MSSSQVGGVAEAVTDGETSSLVELGDVRGMVKVLVRLPDDPSLRRRLGAKARAAAVREHSVANSWP